MRIPHKNRTVLHAAPGWLWAGILLLLASCGTLQTDVAPGDSLDHAFIAVIDISGDDARQAIEAAYGADVIVWRPEGGFAILGLPDSGAELSLLARGGRVSANRGVVTLPSFEEANAQGVSAWAGSVSAWAGSVSAWAGGVSAWAGGTANPFPGNEAAWTQIQLGQAQNLALKRGQGIVVAVIDTGLDLNHVALAGKLAASSGWLDLVDGDTDPHEGYVLTCVRWKGKICQQTSPVKTGDGPFFGHGTAVAGVILQAAPNATVLPIRVLSSWGSGDATNVVTAIDHAISRGARVINLSLGTSEPVAAIDTMLAYAGQLGIVVVASSGNTGTTSVTYPAATAALSAHPLAVSVGSVDGSDRKSSFSSYGALEMLAPGEGVRTLFPGDLTAAASGTSFAAPWVSGVVALILGEGGRSGATPAVVDASQNIHSLNPSFIGMLGKGRLDSYKAVQNALSAR